MADDTQVPVRIIAIDGPAGAGKSTIARRLAQEIDWAYLDTGAMYRALTLLALEAALDLARAEDLVRVARGMDLELAKNGTVRIGGRDVTAEIRTAAVNAGVSVVARIPAVRDVMVSHQRRFAERHRSVVAEGRDIGSVVFPEADLKVYLDAEPDERARRRLAESADGGSVADMRTAIEERDRQDSTREVAPLVQAEGATRIDTTGMALDEVLGAVLSRVRSAIRPQTAG